MEHKKELEYFEIDGAFGGNQDWFTNVVMNIGGCAAATACDCCIYLAKHMKAKELYPFDADCLNKEDYKRFSQIMKPYIRPRVGGVKKLAWFISGFQRYLEDIEAAGRIVMEEFSGEHTVKEAERFIKGQINKNMPVPVLLLQHKDREQFKDYIWHWFLIVGYEQTAGDIKIKTATYGEAVVFSLKEMWETGYAQKGGLVKIDCNDVKRE